MKKKKIETAVSMLPRRLICERNFGNKFARPIYVLIETIRLCVDLAWVGRGGGGWEGWTVVG